MLIVRRRLLDIERVDQWRAYALHYSRYDLSSSSLACLASTATCLLGHHAADDFQGLLLDELGLLLGSDEQLLVVYGSCCGLNDLDDDLSILSLEEGVFLALVERVEEPVGECVCIAHSTT